MVRPVAICAIIATLLVVQAAFAFGKTHHSGTAIFLPKQVCILCAPSQTGTTNGAPVILAGVGIVLSDGSLPAAEMAAKDPTPVAKR